MTIDTLFADIRFRTQTARDMMSLLSEHQKKRYRLFVLWMFIASLLEIATLGVVVSFLKAATSPELISTTAWGRAFQDVTGLSSAWQAVVALGFAIIALVLFKNGMAYAMFSSFNRFVYGIATSCSRRKLEEYFLLDFQDIEQGNSSEYARQVIHVPIEFAHHVVLGSMVILSEAMVVTLLTIAVCLFNGSAFLLIIGFLVPFIAVSRYVSIRILRTARRTIHTLSDNNARVLSDILNAYVDARIYRKEEYFVERYGDMQRILNGELAMLNSVNTLPARLSEVFLVCALVVVFCVSQGSTAGQAAGISTLAAVFVASLYRIVPSVNRMLTMWSNLHTYAPTISMLRPSGNAHASKTAQLALFGDARLGSAIELRGVSFRYEGRRASLLHGVSMTIRKGDAVGIVGRSGSGKTTLLHLLLRLLKPQRGLLLLDGKPSEDVDASSWRAMFAFVRQRPFLLHETIEKNIALGERPEEIDYGKLVDAISLVGLTEVIEDLPDALETNVGEGGKQLSGGQKQRLVIARALYKNAEVFIFDEATSELDGIAELEIVETIRALQKRGKTIIMVSHRPDTLVHCNVVYELSNGTLRRRRERASVRRKTK